MNFLEKFVYDVGICIIIGASLGILFGLGV